MHKIYFGDCMYPGGRLSPRMLKQMQKMMKDFGMDAEDLDVVRVVFEFEEDKTAAEQYKSKAQKQFEQGQKKLEKNKGID